MAPLDLAQALQNLNLDGDDAASRLISAAKENWRVFPAAVAKLIENVSKTGKADAPVVVNALNVFTTLANSAMEIAQPYVCSAIPVILRAAGNKTPSVRTAATEAVTAITAKMSPNCLREVLPYLFSASKIEENWQTRTLALKVLATFGDHAPEQLGFALPDVVPEVTSSMSDTKKDVKEAAYQAMVSACDVIGNRDIEHMTSRIVRSITNPEEVPEIMHELAGVTFVQSVQSPALAMVVPLLLRGLTAKPTATRRQSAVIIDNMSKLVDEPIDAAPFLPLLMPALERAADAMSDPEARGVAEKAAFQLNRLSKLCESAKARVNIVTYEGVNNLLLGAFPDLSTNTILANHITLLACSLISLRHFEVSQWEEVSKLLTTVTASAADGIAALIPKFKELVKPLQVLDEDDDGEELCNCQFTLAYGTKILLHNTNMRLKRGAKYGLLGGNDSGKTTLMRSIANGSVEGFPDASTVRVVFVEADILGELSHLSCVDYVMQDPKLAHLSREEVLATMASVGFTDTGKAKPHHAVSTLSGGWRMKLALARAMLQHADILLLDEPTNHLDVINVAWVKNYINQLTNVTAIMVSHDSGFLNDCCTDILHIERLKLHHSKGNLSHFLASHPEVQSYFKLKESKLKFTFPQPGPIEGIKSRSKALMKITNSDFTYPGNTTPTLHNITIQVSMASRVACVGENGAGKSTMIKVLTGEVVPQTGEVWKHPNARVAYVAQHAFHHIEQHLNKTPNEYIRWRYANGDDKESLVKVSMVFTPEEEALQKEVFEYITMEDGVAKKHKKSVAELLGTRRENKQKEYEYEVRFKGGDENWVPMKTLYKYGWEKACKGVDMKIAQRSGVVTRTLSSLNVEKHLADCGLEAEFATHYRMSALSGGQKVKVVIAAAMWMQPHILILDEPTNYLDRESLGALAKAIEEFQGGVVIISHNNEFVSELCPEEWVMDSGRLTTKGDVGWMLRQDDKINDQQIITEMTDALGNVTQIKVKKTLSKRDLKAKLKVLKKKIDDGEELDSDEEELAMENKLL